MKQTVNHSASFNRGSVYLVTVITVAAIASMVLIGAKLRSSTNTTQALITEMTESNVSLLDATEFALQTIASDPVWPSTAQSGTIFPEIKPFGNEDAVYNGTVTDADTDLLPTDATSTYRLKISATNNEVMSSAQIDLLTSKIDYVTILKGFSAINYWPLNETNNPASAVDQIGIVNGAYQSPGVAGGTINGQGAPVPLLNDANDHIEIPWDASFGLRKGSISIWIKLTGTDYSGENYAFLGMQFMFNGVPAINLATYKNGVYAYLNDVGSYSNLYKLNTASDTITVGDWTHIALTWGSAGLQIYINGSLMASDPSNTNNLLSGNQPFHVGGGYNLFQSGQPADGFVGSVAHLALFKKQISAVEVAELAAIKPDLKTYSLVADTWVQVFE